LKRNTWSIDIMILMFTSSELRKLIKSTWGNLGGWDLMPSSSWSLEELQGRYQQAVSQMAGTSSKVKKAYKTADLQVNQLETLTGQYGVERNPWFMTIWGGERLHLYIHRRSTLVCTRSELPKGLNCPFNIRYAFHPPCAAGESSKRSGGWDGMKQNWTPWRSSRAASGSRGARSNKTSADWGLYCVV